MKLRYNVTGKTVQVADKGLNCARNIYAAVKEAHDGYIFSKSVQGRCLSQTEKEWILLENSANVYTEYFDDAGNLKYRLKSCVDTYEYEFEETDPDSGDKVKTKFSVEERRVVSFNPGLAAKQKIEISKMKEKAAKYISYKDISKEELGDSSKYIKVTNKDKNGKKVIPKIELDEEKIREDEKLQVIIS